MRLQGGVVPEAGTVEYCTGGTWKAVCDYGWDVKDSFVVCRQLGLPATGNYVQYASYIAIVIITIHAGAVRYRSSYFGVHPFQSDIYFNCFGNESSLSSCQSSTYSSCGSEDAAGVHCRGELITGTYYVSFLYYYYMSP